MSGFSGIAQATPALQTARAAPISPHILKAGIILLDPVTTQMSSIVVLQYNPDQLSRTLQLQAATGEPVDRSEALPNHCRGGAVQGVAPGLASNLNHVTAPWEAKGSTEWPGVKRMRLLRDQVNNDLRSRLSAGELR